MTLGSNQYMSAHGMTYSPTWVSWISMRNRCIDRREHVAKNYRDRGIKVCDRWQHSFINFFADMGLRPEGTSLDRIDNDGNYEPGNCRWATRSQQQKNKRPLSEETRRRMSIAAKGMSEETRRRMSIAAYARHKRLKVSA